MKIHYPLIMLFSLIVFSACKKKDAPLLTSVEGRWRLVKVDGCFSGQGAHITDKQELILQGREYRLFVDDKLIVTDTFHFEQTTTSFGKEWTLLLGKSPTYYARFTSNAMFLENRNPDACSPTYAKVY